ncbi:CIC11C00000001181 [Sungouiella intermedia]|uniref:CIC11C00000001181 n=1 Tax=Sungouiella intermedia TaxID=45354 RepID=A0A1L0DES2_9ASCO|nr:CIC11C00000001181 [[Candida] intermedia]
MVHDTQLYDLLAVPASASLEEITKSYKRLALRYHPDKTNHDPELTEKFKDATRAYEILKDASMRQVYDVYGMGGLDGTVAEAQQPQGLFSTPFACPLALTLFSQIFSDMNSMFNGGQTFNNGFLTFGFSAPQHNAVRNVLPAPADPTANVLRRGQDIHHTFNVTLTDMYYGKTVKFQLPKTTKCSVCDGQGCTQPRTCRVCKGSGRVVITTTDQFLKFQELCSCSPCRGTGTYYNKQNKCPLCDDGYLTVKKIIKVMILPGSKNGDKVILQGQSDEGKNIIPGDLIIHLKETPPKNLVRRFNDLYLEQDIDLRTALLGGSIIVHDFLKDGQDLQIFINAHGQPGLNTAEDSSILKGEVVGTINQGSVKIVKGLGMPINKHVKNGVFLQGADDGVIGNLDLYKRGDLFIRFNVQIPQLHGFASYEDLLILSRILPQSPPSALTESTKVHHLSNLRNSAAKQTKLESSDPIANQPSEVLKTAKDAEDSASSSPDNFDYDQLDIDSQDDVEQEDNQFYETEWLKDDDLRKRRKSTMDSPIPSKVKKAQQDQRQGLQA